MSLILKLAVASLAIALGAVPAASQSEEAKPQQGHGQMSGMGMMHNQGMSMMSMGSGDEGPASMAMRGINMKMHRDMAITFTGNPDVDFAKGMIPHHQGAIDMAKIVLAFGKDPEIRKLAEEIIKAQEAEIALLHGWLSKQGQ